MMTYTHLFTKLCDFYTKDTTLCSIENGCAPSKIIYQAWHQHITYTKNYYAICKELGKFYIHHQPANTFEEQTDCRKEFEKTVQKYKEIFTDEPPEQIWKRNTKCNCGWGSGTNGCFGQDCKNCKSK